MLKLAISKNLSLVEDEWFRLKELLEVQDGKKIDSDSEIVQRGIRVAIESLEKSAAKKDKQP